jgi:hypothetical protein
MDLVLQMHENRRFYTDLGHIWICYACDWCRSSIWLLICSNLVCGGYVMHVTGAIILYGCFV